jgi:hypothetical protein
MDKLAAKRLQIVGEDKYIAERVANNVHDLLTSMAERGDIIIPAHTDDVEILGLVEEIVLNALRDLAQLKQQRIARVTRKELGGGRNLEPDI